MLEFGQIAQFRRDGATQLVVLEVKYLQIREITQFRRDGPSQLIGREG